MVIDAQMVSLATDGGAQVAHVGESGGSSSELTSGFQSGSGSSDYTILRQRPLGEDEGARGREKAPFSFCLKKIKPKVLL